MFSVDPVNTPELDVRDKIAWTFATPIIGFLWENSAQLNQELGDLIRARMSAGSGARNSNAGGWQSTDDLLSWGQPCTDLLKRRIDAMLLAALKATLVGPQMPSNLRFRIDCWANVNQPGDYNVVHNHPNALWSGVYYVARGESDPDVPQAGKLELLDPREAVAYVQVGRTTFNERCFIDNTPGFMLMFPGWVRHMVHPHRGTGSRISIAFNALPAS
jgi:uncharacterized protein (TIGR02466 family)